MTIESISETLESLSEEAEPLEQSVYVSGEYGEVTQTFTYLGSVIHSSFGCEGNRRLGRACSTINSLDEGVWRCQYV